MKSHVIAIAALSLMLTSCSGGRTAPERVGLDQVYQGAGTEKYFLPDLPPWANFSVVANCQRKIPVRYLDFEALYKSYNLTYEQLVQLQYLFNKKITEYKKNTGRELLYMQDENFYFYNAYEQVVGGGRGFLVPDYKQINLIWIDPILSDQKIRQRFDKLMKSSKIESGHPVFVSTCMSGPELEAFISKNGFASMGARAISQEFFSPYNSQFIVGHEYGLDFSLLMSDKSIYLFAPWFPKEFKGIDKQLRY